MGRLRSNGYGHALLGALLALAVAGCGSQTGAAADEDPSADVVDAPESEWEDTGLPYGGLEEDGDTRRLSFAGHSVLVPATHELSTAGATADAGIFQLTPPDGESELWQLTSEGEWSQITTGVARIALADVGGQLVAWVAGADEADGWQEREDTKAVVYDTGLGQVVAELPASDVPGDDLVVTVVDGGGIVLSANSSTEDRRKEARHFLWRPETGELTEFADDSGENMAVITAYDDASGAYVYMTADGTSAVMVRPQHGDRREIGFDGAARFNSDASELVVIGYGQARLMDATSLETIPLDTPISPDDRHFFEPGAFAWTADDRLAVIGVRGDEDSQRAYLCTTSTGACQDLGDDYLGFSSAENSARGQFVYHDEPEGD